MCELDAKIIAESELLQPALNEIHKFYFQHWSRSRGTCGTGSGAPNIGVVHPAFKCCQLLGTTSFIPSTASNEKSQWEPGNQAMHFYMQSVHLDSNRLKSINLKSE